MDSLNPYSGIKVLTGNSPEELADLINQIMVPIKIIQVVAVQNRYTVFFTGDVRIKKTKRKEVSNNG